MATNVQYTLRLVETQRGQPEVLKTTYFDYLSAVVIQRHVFIGYPQFC